MRTCRSEACAFLLAELRHARLLLYSRAEDSQHPTLASFCFGLTRARCPVCSRVVNSWRSQCIVQTPVSAIALGSHLVVRVGGMHGNHACVIATMRATEGL